MFNFNTLSNASIIPPIPFLGLVLIVGGLIYAIKPKLNRSNLITLFGVLAITTFFIFFLGDITIHFFAIIIMPLFALGVLNIKNIEKNLLPLLILSVIYFLFMSIVPLGAGEHIFPMWIIIPLLSAVFFIVVPKIYSKTIQIVRPNLRNAKIIQLILIALILLVNLGFSYKLFEDVFYDDTYSGIKNEFLKLFTQKKPLQTRGTEYKQIGEILSKQPGIENSYVMANSASYAYYANSKFLFSYFQEGIK